MQSVVLTELGVIVLQDQKCIKSFPFDSPAADYVRAKDGDGPDGLAGYIGSSGEDFKTDRVSMCDALKKISNNIQMMSEAEIEDIQSSKLQMLVDAGFAQNPGDAMDRLRDFAVQLSSLKIAQTSESADLHIIQAIGALDEIDRDINIKGARVREWYGLHFPELENTVDSISGYARIAAAGGRGDLTAEIIEDAGFPPEKVEMLSVVSENSRGGDISDENLAIVQALACQVLELYRLRAKIEERVESAMEEMAPNVTAVLGAAVGARILARAGSLKRLAMMPSSTIQILGAEKALFRSMKTGSQPPKHGLLFQHHMVHAAPRWQRGKIARTVAAKAAIAARVDLHQAGLNETLLEKLNVRIKEIGEKFAEPTPKKSPPQDSGRRRGTDRGDKGTYRGRRDADRGGRRADRGGGGAGRGRRDADRGGRYSDHGSRGTSRGGRYADRGSGGADRGSRYADRSSRGADSGSKYADRGSGGADRGSRYANRGSRDADSGGRDADRGQRYDSRSQYSPRQDRPDGPGKRRGNGKKPRKRFDKR